MFQCNIKGQSEKTSNISWPYWECKIKRWNIIWSLCSNIVISTGWFKWLLFWSFTLCIRCIWKNCCCKRYCVGIYCTLIPDWIKLTQAQIFSPYIQNGETEPNSKYCLKDYFNIVYSNDLTLFRFFHWNYILSL